jgi:hypothetical protein
MAGKQGRRTLTQCAEIAEHFVRQIKGGYRIPSKDERPELVCHSSFAYIGSVREPAPGVDYERDFCLITWDDVKERPEDNVPFVEVLVNRRTGEPTLQYIRFPKKTDSAD